MKTKNIFLILGIAAFVYLFYEQSAGINRLIFSVLMIILSLVFNRENLKSKTWIAVTSGVLLSGVGVMFYGNVLSLVANFVALAALGGLTFHQSYSLIFAIVQTPVNYILKPINKLSDLVTKIDAAATEDPQVKSKKSGEKLFLRIALPSLIVLVFVVMYKNSNPLFSSFINSILSSISWGLIGFTIYASYVIYFFFHQYQMKRMQQFDANQGNILVAYNPSEFSIFQTSQNELSAAKITFILLNILLFTVNAIDIQFILSPIKEIPDFSAYIHQGINNSIFSVLIAILVVLFYFRGNLNFIAENKTLKMLAVLWIIQNVILLSTCFHKNFSYIDGFGLTHKRIGVYAYLLVTFIGLSLTFLKIMKRKSNMFLVRTNTWSLFILLIFSCTINWNRLIFKYNIAHHPEIEANFYVYNLGYEALPYFYEEFMVNTKLGYYDSFIDKMRYKVEGQRAEFLARFRQQSWQSWTWNDQRIYDELIKIK